MVAILYTIVRASLPTAIQGSMPPIWQLTVVCVVYTMHSILLLLPSFYPGFGSKRRWAAFIALLLQFIFVAPLVIFCLTYFAGFRFNTNHTLDFYAFSLGYVTSIVSVTLGLRACGFRLIVREPKQPTIAVLPWVIRHKGSGKKNRKRKQNQHNRAIADLNVPVLGGEIEVQRGFRKSL